MPPPCYTQVCGVLQCGGGRNPGGCSKAESRPTTATMDNSATDHPCDFIGSTCSSLGRGATLGWDASLVVGGLFLIHRHWGEVWSLMLHSYNSANGHPCDFTGSTCSSLGRGATLGLNTSVWCSSLWWQTALQCVRGVAPSLYTGVWWIAVWWWQKPGRMQQG